MNKHNIIFAILNSYEKNSMRYYLEFKCTWVRPSLRYTILDAESWLRVLEVNADPWQFKLCHSVRHSALAILRRARDMFYTTACH